MKYKGTKGKMMYNKIKCYAWAQLYYRKVVNYLLAMNSTAKNANGSGCVVLAIQIWMGLG